MLGEADQEKGWWEVATFHTRFVKEGDAWKIRELRRFPLLKSDVFLEFSGFLFKVLGYKCVDALAYPSLNRGGASFDLVE